MPPERWRVVNEGDPKCLHPVVQSRTFTQRDPYEARVCVICRRELRRPYRPAKVTMPKV